MFVRAFFRNSVRTPAKRSSSCSIKDALTSEKIGQVVSVNGWVKTVRRQKRVSFLELNDGSCLQNLQVVSDNALPMYVFVFMTRLH